MLPCERRFFVRTHPTCVFGYGRRLDGPAMSVVHYIPADNDDLLVATMADRAKAKAVARNGKVSLCVIDETWPFAYLQVHCDAVIDYDGETLVDGESMTGVCQRLITIVMEAHSARDTGDHLWTLFRMATCQPTARRAV